MKLNGKNIITDKDITLSNGQTLQEAIDDIQLLKSNVKFIYKHGTLGSGGGNGGGSGSGKLNVRFYVQQDNGLLPVEDGAQILFSSPGTYNMQIKLYGTTETSRYDVTLYYDDAPKPLEYKLTSANDFMVNGSLNLKTNGNITLEVIDSDGEPSISKYSYITSIYSITSPKIIKDVPSKTVNDISVIQDNNLIFMDNIKNDGIVFAFACKFTMPPTSDSYVKYTDWLGNIYNIPLVDLGISTDRSSLQSIFFKLTGDNSLSSYIETETSTVDIKEFLSDSNNAGIYEARLEFNVNIIDIKNETHTINDVYTLKNNLIPSSLFLMINSTGGKLFNSSYSYDYVMNCSDDEQFMLGSTLITAVPFFGNKNDARTHNLWISVEYDYNEETGEFDSYNDNVMIMHTMKDQQKESISIPLLSAGYEKINFRLECEGYSYQVSYYVNVKNISTGFNWFSIYKQQQIATMPDTHAAFKQNYNMKPTDNHNIIYEGKELNTLSSIKMSANDKPKFYKLNINNNNWASFDQLLEMSIQYSQINDTDIPIFSLNAVGSSDSSIKPFSLFVYQNKIALSSSESTILDGVLSIESFVLSRDLYIPLVSSVNPNDKNLYTLLTLYKQFESTDLDENNYYGLYALIDGIYDSAFGSFSTNYQLFDSITFYQGNYSVNFIETLCLPHNNSSNDYKYNQESGSIIYDKKYMTQYNLEYYYYSFLSNYKNNTINITDDELYLIQYFSEFEYDDSIAMVRCTGSSAENIAQSIDIPVLLLTYINNDPNKMVNDKVTLESWLSTSFGQDDPTGANIPVKIYWSKGKSHLELIKFEDNALDFSINIQGSTTKQYKGKNFELYAPATGDENTKFVFSPNITHNPVEQSDEWKQMLLPEESFTLKADAVDSSHSNNNAIGDFVNDNLTNFADAITAQTSFTNFASIKYINKIRKCLTGFPILVFLNTTYKAEGQEEENNYYYLGIYNFNLGRNSHFNLGYNNLKIIEDAIEGRPNDDGFVIYKLTNSIQRVPGLFVAEIQYNSEYYDWSQYGESILYQIPGEKEKLRMWDDFVYGYSLEEQRQCLTKLVESVSKTGGYIFAKIGKVFSEIQDNNYGYKDWYSALDENNNPIEQVPNFLWQAKRTINSSGENVYTFNRISDDQLVNGSQLMTSLQTMFKSTLSTGLDENTNEPNIPILDYTSVSEYYTTCMAFGMIDSVEKNFNIKSWTSTNNTNKRGTFYAAFYDMDTGLGITNTGKRITYFSYSDYWDSSIKNGELAPAKIIRDWSPSSNHDEAVEFFDIPSSYLFAIAKYAPMIINSNNWNDYRGFENNPTVLWAKWRRSNGCLRNAKYFMDKYFINRLKNVPISAINWNYRFKYFVKDKDSNGISTLFNSTNFMKFYGTKRAYTENWLNNRLHIMDAYMNLGDVNIKIETATDSYPMLSPGTLVDESNDDIVIKREIFNTSNTLIRYNTNSIEGPFRVKAVPYSPLIIRNPSGQTQYLFPSDSTQSYKITIPTIAGTPEFAFYGSTNWYSLDAIDKFITEAHTLTINSQFFTDIVSSSGAKNSCNTWAFNVPSVKQVSLTSSNFSGSINLSNTDNSYYPNLDSVNIQNSKINFTTSGTNISSIIATNMQAGSSINCTNSDNLSNVRLSGSLNSIIIDAWAEEINIPTDNSYIGCTSITITNRRFDKVKVNIRNAENLTTLRLINCTGLSVYKCPNLETISIEIINSADHEYKFTYLSVDITGSINVYPKKSIKIYTNSQESMNKVADKVDEYGQTIKTSIADLSAFNLNYLSIKNSNIQKIYIPDDCTIMTSEFGFAYNKNFVGFIGNSNIYITGPSTFEECPKFRLLQATNEPSESELINLYVDPSCTNLSRTFYIYVYENGINLKTGSLDYVDAKHFFDNCSASNVGNVENIDYMFEGQYIKYTMSQAIYEYYNKTCGLSLKNFKKCKSFQNVFRYTQIEFFNRYMFEGDFMSEANIGDGIRFANPITNLSDQYDSDGKYVGKATMPVYATHDFLYGIIDKIIEISLSHPITLVRVINDAQYINLSTIFPGLVLNPMDDDTMITKYPIRLNTINGFNITTGYGSSSNIFDFSNIFRSEWTVAHDNGIIINELFSRGTYKVNSYAESGLGNLFENVKLKLITSTLCLTASNIQDAVNIRHLMDWHDGISNLDKICSSADSVSTSFGFPKTVTYTEFHEIMDELLGFTPDNKNSKLTEIFDLFANCTITEENTNRIGDHLLLVSDEYKENQCENIVKIGNLFNSLKIKDIDDNNIPIPLTWQTLYCLPNLIDLHNSFTNIYIKYPLSFDFFHKRKEYNKMVEVDLNESGTLKGKLHMFRYNQDIVNLQNAFANMTLYREDQKPPKAFNSNGVYNQMFNGESCIKEDYIVDDNGNRYDYYYINGERFDLIQPSEILDYQKAQEQYYSIYNDIFIRAQDGNEDHDFVNVLDDTGDSIYAYEDGYTGTFVSPDILYGCNRTSNIGNIFSCSNSGNRCVLSGTIPEHMLYRISNIEKFTSTPAFDIRSISCVGVFTNLSIMPIKFAEYNDGNYTHKFYQFVPNNFITRLNISNTFTFKMLMPKQDGTNYICEHYFVYMSDSISKDTTFISGSIPTLYDRQIGFAAGGSTYIMDLSVPGATRYPIYLNVMGNIEKEYDENTDTTTVRIKEGINTNYFKSLYLDGIFNARLMHVISGNLFMNNCITANMWRPTYLNSGTLISCETPGINYFARFFLPIENEQFISVSGQGVRVHKDSIDNIAVVPDPDNKDYAKLSINTRDDYVISNMWKTEFSYTYNGR